MIDTTSSIDGKRITQIQAACYARSFPLTWVCLKQRFFAYHDFNFKSDDGKNWAVYIAKTFGDLPVEKV